MSSPADCVSPFFGYLFSMPQIDQSDPSFVIDHEVGGLDISINKSMAMHVPQNESDLANYYPGEVGTEITYHFEQLMERQAFYWL